MKLTISVIAVALSSSYRSIHSRIVASKATLSSNNASTNLELSPWGVLPSIGHSFGFSSTSPASRLRGFLGFLALEALDTPLDFGAEARRRDWTEGAFLARLRGFSTSSSSSSSSSSSLSSSFSSTSSAESFSSSFSRSNHMNGRFDDGHT